MNPLSLKQGLEILREINISAIQMEAEQQFTLLLVGRPELTALLARETETVPGGGRIVQLQAPLPVGLEIQRPAAALLVSGAMAVDADLATASAQLRTAKVPVVEVQIGAAAASPAAVQGAPASQSTPAASPATVQGAPASQSTPAVSPDAVQTASTSSPVAAHDAADSASAELAKSTAVASPVGSGRVLLPDNPSADDIELLVAPAIVALNTGDSELLLPLARQFPAMREAYIRDLIEDVSRVNASYAFSTGIAQVVPVLGLPLALADIIVLTKNQLVMAYKIALAAGKPATGRLLVGELVGVLGGSLLFRQIARELVGLAPGIGIIPKVAIAYAGTRLVGQAARIWALEDRKLEGSELGYMYREALDGGRRVAAELQSRAGQLRGRGDESAAGADVVQALETSEAEGSGAPGAP